MEKAEWDYFKNERTVCQFINSSTYINVIFIVPHADGGYVVFYRKS